MNIMKICVLLLMLPASANAQLYVGPASTLYVPAGGILQVDTLTLQPTATLVLSNNRIEKSNAPQWAPGPIAASISQVYTMDTPLVFQGTASITYANANLNGNNAASLVMVNSPEPADSFQYAASSSVNVVTQTVSALFAVPTRLGKVSVTTGGIPLPVNVTSFDAWPDGKRAKLAWQLADEKELAQYLIERSADGLNFYPLLLTPAGGKPNYTLWDEAPLTPNNYYRLSAKDFSGKLSHYGVRKVVFRRSNEGLQISAWPIPAEGELHLSFSEQPDNNGTLMLCDVAGREVMRFKVSGRQMSLPIGHLPPGAYTLRYSGNVRLALRIEKM